VHAGYLRLQTTATIVTRTLLYYIYTYIASLVHPVLSFLTVKTFGEEMVNTHLINTLKMIYFGQIRIKVECLWQLTVQPHRIILNRKNLNSFYQHKICKRMPVMIVFP